MLELNYTINDPTNNKEVLDTINEFLQNYTNKDYRTEIFNEKVMVFVYDLACAYEAMQIINAIDVIIDPLGFGFILDFIHYSEYTKK